MVNIFRRLIRYLRLPSEVTTFEDHHLRRMNRIALGFFWLHVPAFMIVAALSGTSVIAALMLSLGVMFGPTIAYAGLRKSPRLLSTLYGFTAMVMGGVLVYVGQGPMQIEMHFYFFVLIALLAVFGNPIVIVVAAATVAVHHLVVWLVIPAAVFNYEASVWAVAVHALFVVLESVAACFVARSFFDNVIGLEKIVTRRTTDLDARNRDMAMILDNVAQGFVTIDLEGAIGSERSKTLATWFGVPAADTRIWSYLAAHDPNLEAWIELSFDSIKSRILPFEVSICQLPATLTRDGRTFGLDYLPIGVPATSILVVVSDQTDERARQRAEGAQRELIGVIEKAYRDRAGFLAFIADADELVRASITAQDEPLSELKRRIHTLKGNASLFGVTSVADVCHELENQIEEECTGPDAVGRALLADAWKTFHSRIDLLLGITQRRSILVDWEEYQSVLSAICAPEPAWAASIRSWGQDATRPYLARFGEQARQLALKLGRGEIDVEVVDNNLRIDADKFSPLWSALVHVVRNAVDHGTEAPATRLAAGKPARSRLILRTALSGDDIDFVISDDGNGIAWAQVAIQARQLGIPAETQHDLEEAVFAMGLSTATEISHVSGRGVGMGALRAACRDLGGRVELTSEPGRGTTVRCRIPRSRETYRRERVTSGPRPA